MSEFESYNEQRERERKDQSLRKNKAFWQDLCPDSYKATEAAKLPHPTESKRVIDWQCGATGLLLVGPSRCGKTRSAWMLIKRLADEGRRVMAFDGLSWFISVSRAFGNLETTDEFFDEVCKADVLFLDDVFRGRMTEAQDVGMWGVVERRMAAGRPIILTTNATGKTLEEKCGPQVIPIIARLRECCEVISFGRAE